ncbi:hypothetical protein [Clostridium paraputrificum]|uniref:hypothetical protein n=1 Tax=Clostridium paraputrificum TaxID=29363 RepID=UPI001B3C7F02|nr:hypothetical protein [Clostridium paraputrificum]
MSKILYRNMEEAQGVVINTSRGDEKWNAVDYYERWGRRFFLMEHSEYGDEVPCIVLDDLGNVREWNWYDTLEEWVEA